jgi:hypothetical protein
MRTLFIIALLLSLTACSSVNWQCESTMSGVMEGCSQVATKVMQSIPMHCSKGATANSRVSAEKNQSQNMPHYRSEAAVQCQK